MRGVAPRGEGLFWFVVFWVAFPAWVRAERGWSVAESYLAVAVTLAAGFGLVWVGYWLLRARW